MFVDFLANKLHVLPFAVKKNKQEEKDYKDLVGDVYDKNIILLIHRNSIFLIKIEFSYYLNFCNYIKFYFVLVTIFLTIICICYFNFIFIIFYMF